MLPDDGRGDKRSRSASWFSWLHGRLSTTDRDLDSRATTRVTYLTQHPQKTGQRKSTHPLALPRREFATVCMQITDRSFYLNALAPRRG
jgi:hypothetical protein